MARTGLMTAGIALSTVLLLAASCDAAPPRAAKAIAPPKPEVTAKTAMAPEPKSEPQVVPAESPPEPSPPPEPAAGNPPPRKAAVRTARHARQGVAQNSHSYRYGTQPQLRSRRLQERAERPMSGPVLADRGSDCDEACRYRAWFRDYNAWYQAYGRRYAEYPPLPPSPDIPPPSSGNRDWPRTAFRPDDARAWSERDRLDPWHGYDGHDGPQNGY